MEINRLALQNSLQFTQYFFSDRNSVENDRNCTVAFKLPELFERMDRFREVELSFMSFHALIGKKSQND